MVGGKQIEPTGNQDIVKASREPRWSQSQSKSISKDRKHTHGEINGTHATKKWAKEPYDPSEDYKLVLHKYKESY